MLIVLYHLIAWFFKLMNIVDNILQLFGIKIRKVTRETILKGLPDEVHDEINQPDIKFLFDEFTKAIEKDKEMSFVHRSTLLHICRDELKKRLIQKKTLQEIPAILQVKIDRPVFILGAPRTGTTFLQRLLARDKRFRAPMFWELMNPFPPGKVEDYTKDPRYKKTVLQLGARKAFLSENIDKAHETAVDEPEECLALLSRSFYHVLHSDTLDCLNDFARTIRNLGSSDTMTHVYRYYKESLQVLAYDQDMEQKRYLSKAPNHLLHVEALLETFPDAQLIFTHRPLSVIVPSCLSLVVRLCESFGGTYNLKMKKRIVAALRAMLISAARIMEKLEKRGARNTMCSLAYKDLMSDPLGEVRKLYDFLRMTLTPDTESAFRHYLEDVPKNAKFRGHKYTMEQFDLTKEDLQGEFKEYIDHMIRKGFPEEDIL